MNQYRSVPLAIAIVVGLGILGAQLAGAISDFKAWDRVVTVKGLSERDFEADHVIWPIQYTEASNDLSQLHNTLKSHSSAITQFLQDSGLPESDITVGRPEITDKLAQRYGGTGTVEFRYSALQTVTVYSTDIAKVRALMNNMTALLAKGIVLSEQGYNSRSEFVFSRLNEVKPAMIAEATINAREVALKFASDSNSQLGKIKRANQGQFTITSRDNQHPHIKRVRVVSTIQYTLVD